MMMKSKMKKMLAISLAVIVLLVPSLSFADEIAPTTQRNFRAAGRVNERLGERLGAFKDGLKERAGEAEERKEVYRERLAELIGEYAPELLVEFESFWDAHDDIHEQLKAERERIAEAKKEEAITFFEMIKAKVTSGEMTREEARVEIEAFRAAEKAEREAVKAEFEALKEAMDVPVETIKALHEALKVAAEAGDGEAITGILEEMISYQPQHLAFDQAKLELMMTK